MITIYPRFIARAYVELRFKFPLAFDLLDAWDLGREHPDNGVS